MKKLWCLLLAGLLLLSGCAAEPAWETVNDENTAAASAEERAPCSIRFGVPEDAAEQMISPDGTRNVYTQAGGDYEIVSEVIPAESLDEAVRHVSGFGADEVQLLETTRFGLPEYRFAWSDESDEGRYVSRASLIRDGSYFYSLVFSVREGLFDKYSDCAAAVFSSFGLYGDEEF